MNDADARGGSPWLAILLLLGAGVVAAAQVGKAPVALDAVRAGLGLELATASWLLSAFAIVGAVAGVAVGLVVDRAGARRMVVAALLLLGLASVLGATAQGAPLLLATRAVEGIGFLAVSVAAPALIVALARPRDLSRAMAAWATFMPVGLTLALLGAPALAALGWRGFWLLNGAVLVAYAALLACNLRSAPAVAAPSADLAGDLRETVLARGPWLLAGLFVAFSTAFFAVFGFLPSILALRLAVDVGTASLLAALAGAVNALGNLLGGLLLTRRSRRPYILVGSFAVMTLCSIFILGQGLPGLAVYALCLLFSIVGGFIPVALLDAAADQAPRPELVGATIGLMMQGSSAGLVLGPAAAGAIAQAAGWPPVTWLVAAAAVAAAALVAALATHRGPKVRPVMGLADRVPAGGLP